MEHFPNIFGHRKCPLTIPVFGTSIVWSPMLGKYTVILDEWLSLHQMLGVLVDFRRPLILDETVQLHGPVIFVI